MARTVSSFQTAKAIFLSLIALLACASASGAQAQVKSEARIALVIGNSDYANVPLKNPANDARDMAAALQKIGFTVTLVVDGEFAAMNRAVRDFGNAIKRQDAVALFYFSGHGVQYQGANYLIPARADIQSADELAYSAVNAEQVYAKMEASGAKTNIIILDACRNNPFPGAERALERGLAVVSNVQPPRSLIVYSTAPGKTAQDGEGRNGVFTAALLKHLADPGLDAELMIRRVREDVIAATGGAQVPWHNSSITGGGFLFAGSGEINVTTDPSGAEILVNGERRGLSPITLTDLPRYSDIELTARMGTRSATRKVSLRDTASLDLALTLEAERGALALQANESFTTILLDGAAVSASAAGTLEGLDAGTHRLELRGDSSIYKGEVTVLGGKTTTIKASLVPFGSLVLNLPPNMTCTIEGMGITDSTARKDYGQLPAGDYKLSVSGGDYDPYAETITVKRGLKYEFAPRIRFTAAYLSAKYSAELDSLALAEKRSYVDQIDIDQVAAFAQRVKGEGRSELQPLIAKAEELRARLASMKTQPVPTTQGTGVALTAKGPEQLYSSYAAELATLAALEKSDSLTQGDIDRVSIFTLKAQAQPYQDFRDLASRSASLESKLVELRATQLYSSYTAELATLTVLEKSDSLTQGDIDKVAAFSLKAMGQPYQDFQELASKSDGLKAKLVELMAAQAKLAPYKALVAKRDSAQADYEKVAAKVKSTRGTANVFFGIGAGSGVMSGILGLLIWPTYQAYLKATTMKEATDLGTLWSAFGWASLVTGAVGAPLFAGLGAVVLWTVPNTKPLQEAVNRLDQQIADYGVQK
jgi:hypothetical protein